MVGRSSWGGVGRSPSVSIGRSGTSARLNPALAIVSRFAWRSGGGAPGLAGGGAIGLEAAAAAWVVDISCPNGRDSFCDHACDWFADADVFSCAGTWALEDLGG
ncbi:MAG: hypothetical protein VKK04_16310 [Synechococcales bacterium]|nr:hypothetical protein [Synechococcales bacterium]